MTDTKMVTGSYAGKSITILRIPTEFSDKLFWHATEAVSNSRLFSNDWKQSTGTNWRRLLTRSTLHGYEQN